MVRTAPPFQKMPGFSRTLLGQCFPKCRCLQPLTLWILHFVLDLTSWLTRCIKFLIYKLYCCPSYEVPALKQDAPDLYNATKSSVCSFAFMATTYVARYLQNLALVLCCQVVMQEPFVIFKNLVLSQFYCCELRPEVLGVWD